VLVGGVEGKKKIDEIGISIDLFTKKLFCRKSAAFGGKKKESRPWRAHFRDPTGGGTTIKGRLGLANKAYSCGFLDEVWGKENRDRAGSETSIQVSGREGWSGGGLKLSLFQKSQQGIPQVGKRKKQNCLGARLIRPAPPATRGPKDFRNCQLTKKMISPTVKRAGPKGEGKKARSRRSSEPSGRGQAQKLNER